MVYREEQNFDWRAYALLIAVEATFWAPVFWKVFTHPQPAALVNHHGLELAAAIALAVGLPLILIVGFLRMTTEVTPTHVRVWFGWIPTYRRLVDLAAVTRIEVVRYRPVADYWGWGIRSGRDGERVLNARGDRGVRLDLADGSRLLIGSQRPEELALVLERTAMRPGA
jgi:hypothetical protein